MTSQAAESDALRAVRKLSPDEQAALLFALRRHQAGECTFEEALAEFRDWAETQRAA